MRHPEEAAVKTLFAALADQPFVGTGEPARAGEVADWPVSSAVAIGYRFLHNLAFAEQPPEIVVGVDSTRHSVAVPDDGNRAVGFRGIHVFSPGQSACR